MGDLTGGSGSFVSVTDDHVKLDDMSGAIRETIEYTRQYADEMRLKLGESLENLSAIVGTYNPAITAINRVIPRADRPSFPAKPSFAPLQLDEDWPDGFIPDPAFQEYGLLDFEFVPPTPPAEVDGTFTHTGQAYTSEMWQALFAKVHGAVLQGEYGLPEAVHSVLVAKEQEARRRNQEKEFRAGVAAAGSMGWNLAGGHSAAFLSEFQGEVLQRDQDALNTITAKDFDIANESRKFFIGAAVDLEKMVRSTYDAAEQRSLDAAKAAKEYVARFFAENVKLYLAKWDGVKAKLEALKIKVEAISSRNNSETQKYLGRAQVLEAKIKGITEKNRGKVDVRRGEAEIYQAKVGAVRDEYMALVEEIRINQEAVKAEIDRELKIEELKLTAFSDKTKIAQTIALGVANIGSQGVASALGAINTSLSNSYSGSESRGESWGFDAGIRESHNFDEE